MHDGTSSISVWIPYAFELLNQIRIDIPNTDLDPNFITNTDPHLWKRKGEKRKINNLKKPTTQSVVFAETARLGRVVEGRILPCQLRGEVGYE
jgi:hypothetical protein